MSGALQTQLFEHLREINQGDIDPQSVRSLYMLVRPYTASALNREMGDFFAHPERNRGVFASIVKPIAEQIELAEQGKPHAFTIAPKTGSDLVRELNIDLQGHGSWPIADHLHAAFALVVFGSLQRSTIEISAGRVASLHLHVLGQKEIHLNVYLPWANSGNGVLFPLCEMPNVFGLSQFLPNPSEPGWPMLSIRFVKGKLEVWQSGDPLIIQMPKK